MSGKITWSLAVAVVVLLLVCSSLWAEQSPKKYVTPKPGGKLYIHTGPGTSYPYLGVLHSGSYLEICEQKLYWYVVCLEQGRKGYVYSPTAQVVISATPLTKKPKDAQPPDEPPESTADSSEIKQPDQSAIDHRHEPDTVKPAKSEDHSGFFLRLGAGPGPIDIGNDPGLVQSLNGYNIRLLIGYDFKPLPVRSAFPFRLGVCAGGAWTFAEETSDIVKLTGRAEKFGDINSEIVELALGLRMTPVATPYLDFTIVAGPLYYRYNYQQDFDNPWIQDGRQLTGTGRNIFFSKRGFGYQLNAGLTVYPLYRFLGWYSGFTLGLELRFTHYVYGLSEETDHSELLDKVFPKLLTPVVHLGYQF